MAEELNIMCVCDFRAAEETPDSAGRPEQGGDATDGTAAAEGGRD